MNPLDRVNWNWFWGAYVALLSGWVGYLVATDPGPRPTDYIGNFDPAPAAPEAAVTRVAFDTLTLKDAERLDGRPVVTTFTVGAPPYTWGEGTSLRTIVGPVTRDALARIVILRGNRLHDAGADRLRGQLRSSVARMVSMSGSDSASSA